MAAALEASAGASKAAWPQAQCALRRPGVTGSAASRRRLRGACSGRPCGRSAGQARCKQRFLPDPWRIGNRGSLCAKGRKRLESGNWPMIGRAESRCKRFSGRKWYSGAAQSLRAAACGWGAWPSTDTGGPRRRIRCECTGQPCGPTAGDPDASRLQPGLACGSCAGPCPRARRIPATALRWRPWLCGG